MAQKTFTVASVAGGGSSTQNVTGMLDRSLINLLKVVPDLAGDSYQVQFFVTDGYSSSDKQFDSGLVTGTWVDPVEDDEGTITQHTTTPGMVFICRDADSTQEWHVKVINNDSAARSFAFTVDYEDTMVSAVAVDTLVLTDGVSAPAAVIGSAQLFVDTADGDLKMIFGDGTTKTIVVDT